MNKHFYILFAMLLSSLASMAYEAGDYVLTWTGRYKVAGQNMVVNPSFANVDFTAPDFGWTNSGDGYASADSWAIADEGNAVVSLSSDNDNLLFQSVPVEGGKSYIVALKVKSAEATSSVVYPGSLNRISAWYKANEATDSTIIAKGEVLPQGEWTTLQWELKNIENDGVINICFSKIFPGTEITDIEVLRAAEVYDTRVWERKLAYFNAIMASGEMPEGIEDFQEILGEYIEMMADPAMADDIDQMTSAVGDIETEFENYMLLNSADYMDNINKGLFTSWGKTDKTNGTGDWHCTGDGRWFTAKNVDRLRYEYPGSYNLPAATAAIQKEGVEPGRYMFKIDANAIAYLATKVNGSYYEPNYAMGLNTTTDSCYIYVGADTVKVEPYSNRFVNTYFAFGNVGEDGKLDCGIHFPGFDGTKVGGVFNLYSPVLRVCGINQAALDRAAYVGRIHAQQVAMAGYFPIYEELQASTDYIWGKQALADTAAVYKPLYDASLAYVDADGNDMGIDIPDEYDTELAGYVKALGNTRSAFTNLNKPYTTLVAYTAEAEAILNAPENAGASAATRTALSDAINQAKALIAAASADNENGEEFTAAYNEMLGLVDAFLASTATFDNPAPITVKNPNFKNGLNDWEKEVETGNGTAKTGANAKFNNEDGTGMNVWRGNTAFSKNAVWQKTTVKKAGVYKFFAQAYAYNEDNAKQNAMWNGLSGEDSTRISGIRMWFGKENTELSSDSVNVCTNNTDTVATNYCLTFIKEADGEETVEFGLDARQNGWPTGTGCNAYGFSSCKLFYYGPKDAYETGITNATAAKPADDNATYSLSGIRMSGQALPKGVYVRAGRKVVVK